MRTSTPAIVLGVALATAGIPTSSTAKTYTVGVEKLDYLPYYGVIGGKYSGFAADMFKAFEKHSGMDLEIVPYPVSRLFNQLKKKNIDAKFPDNAIWGAADKKALPDLVYSDPVVQFTDAFLAAPGKTNVKTVSMVRGFTPADGGKFNFQEVNSIKAAASMYINNRVDAIYGNVAVIKYSYKNEGGTDELELLPGVNFSKSHYHMSTFDKDLQSKFNEFLQTDEFKAILTKYSLSK